MKKNTFSLNCFYVMAIFLYLPVQAQAGEVRLVSDTWDYICKVDLVFGINAPQSGKKRSFNDVPYGFSIQGTDRICYRRSADPDNCGSGLGPWNCKAKLTSGTKEFSIR